MATPPFNINEALPGDNDIVSQHPTNARAFRDAVESWLLINHNVNGRHDEVQFDFKADPAAPGASVAEVWASSTGNAAGALKHRDGASGAVEYVGLPPGTVIPFAGSSAPNGYLVCDGSAVSRTTYARLFDVIGTTWGVGDGSTTFNVPDLKGRVIAGVDGGSTRLSSGFFGTTPNLAAVGGAESHTLTQAQLPVVTPAGSLAVTMNPHNHRVRGADGLDSNSVSLGNASTLGLGGSTQGAGGYYTNAPNGAQPYVENTTVTVASATFTGTSFGSGNAHNNVQPTAVMNYLIKT